MRVKMIGLFTLLLILMQASWVGAIAPKAAWQYYKEVPGGKSGFTLIQLDQEVMKNCQASFADLRITDQNDKEIPSLVIQPGQEEIVSIPSLINIIRYADYSSTVFDLGANPGLNNHIALMVEANEDYLREVKLEASNDGNQWGQLGSGKIFSYEGEQANQISYPTANMRYLRVNISNKAGERPLVTISAQVKFLPTNIYEGKLLTAKLISKRSDKERTRIILDLGVPNYIISSVQIPTSDQNFNRGVDCSTTNNYKIDTGEAFIKSERILDYEWQDYHSVKDSIEINQFAMRYLVLSIFNGDSPALNLKDIKVYGCAPALIADLHGPARLWYGAPQATSPNYDLVEFADLISSRDLPVISAGVQQLNPDYQAPVIPWTEKNKWLLDAVVMLVAAGFTVFILRKFRQLPDVDKQNEEVKEE